MAWRKGLPRLTRSLDLERSVIMESGRLTQAMETLTLLGDTVMAEPPATQYSTLALLLEAMANP